jgi:hypothetical protein
VAFGFGGGEVRWGLEAGASCRWIEMPLETTERRWLQYRSQAFLLDCELMLGLIWSWRTEMGLMRSILGWSLLLLSGLGYDEHVVALPLPFFSPITLGDVRSLVIIASRVHTRACLI